MNILLAVLYRFILADCIYLIGELKYAEKIDDGFNYLIESYKYFF